MIDYTYYNNYPNLVMSIMDYFAFDSNSMNKTIASFCEKTGVKTNHGTEYLYDPKIISIICDKLVKKGKMSCLRYDGTFGANSIYATILDKNKFSENITICSHHLNSIVYGFRYIYEYYMDIVIPLVNVDEIGNQQIGSAFIIENYIVTAKHCLENAKEIEIANFNSVELNKADIYVSNNQNIDLAIININTKSHKIGYLGKGEVLDDVLVMGYPSLPGFDSFTTAELANISAESKIDLPTRGSIAAFGDNLFSKTKLMLITAKIRGGNSGGPIINSNGDIVGITSQVPAFEGNYDDLGYGIAVPSNEIFEIMNNPIKLEKKKDLFVDNKYLTKK